MTPETTTKHQGISLFYRSLAMAALIWTVAIAVSLGWNLYRGHNDILTLAKKEGEATINKDLSFRYWATKHGGVYVPVTEETPANPYLSNIPDRDLSLPSGKRLTLMNPAYIMRQTMKMYEKLYGTKGHLTSLKLLNPINKPDEWERKALESFERGVKEASEFTEIEGKPYLRIMKPTVTLKGCLKCHGIQGYKEGEIRGGIAVSVPLTPYLKIDKEESRILFLSHLVIWLLGSTLLGLVFYKGKGFILGRLRSEAALAESEYRLSLALDAASAAWWEWNFKTGETIYSPGYYQMLGYEPNEFAPTYEEWKERVHPDDIGMVEAFLKKHLLEERSDYRNLEMRMRTKDGQWRWIAVSGMIVERDADGNPVRLVGTNLDIDDRKRTEEDVVQLSRKNEMILKAAGEGIYGVDVNGNIVFANRATANILGYTSEELLGKNSHQLFHHTRADGTPYPSAECPLHKSLTMNEVHRGINEVFWAKSGEKIDVEHVNTPLVEDNRIVGTVVVFSDIRVRKMAEQHIREFNEQLEQKVRERTAELEIKNVELERLNKLFVGRELKMVELKEKISQLNNEICRLQA